MALHESLCEIPAMANMTVEILTHMYKLAKGWEMVPEDCDPCQSIPMNPKRKRERFLTDAEFTRLGQVLDEVSGKGSRISAGAVATIRLLMLTGCRRNEIPHPALGACRSRQGRDPHRRRENRQSHGPLVAVGCPRTGGPAAQARQSLGHSRSQAGPTYDRHRRGVGEHPRAGRTPRRAHSRHQAFLRFKGAGARRGPADHRVGCSVTAGWKPPHAMRISRATRSGKPPSESPSASPPISCRRFNPCGMRVLHARGSQSVKPCAGRGHRGDVAAS